MKNKDELKEYLLKEIDKAFISGQQWTEEKSKCKKVFDGKYMLATEMQDYYAGREIALREILIELDK